MSARYQLYQLARGISRLPLIRSLVPRSLKQQVQWRIGTKIMDEYPDRNYMESAILPAIAALRPQRLIDVGLDHYTAHYGKFFDASVDRWTIDISPDVVQFGAPGRHIHANVLDMAQYFEPASVDVIMMNGPFGYGIDRLDEEVRVLEIAFSLLRPGGWLMIGWDRTDKGEMVIASQRGPRDPDGVKDPLELDVVRTRFEHVAPASLPARKLFDDCSHVYDWFRVK